MVWPVLSGNRISEAYEREVFFFSKDINCIEEVNPVRFAREIVGECGGFCKIAIAVLAARKRTRDCRACVHLREACEVQAHVESLACSYIECDFVA